METNIKYDFTGQTVLVTGGARGQGREHALAFARSGATVAICDIAESVESIDYPMSGPADLEETADAIRENGVECRSFAVDVRDDERVAAMVDEIDSDLGGLDVLVNNAGVNAIHEIDEMPVQVWADVIGTNLTGVYYCSRHAARVMKPRRRGRIISTGSANTGLSMPMNGAYTAAKHGVLGLTRAMAIDLGPFGITANVVSPGLVDTALLACAHAPHVPENYFERLLGVGGYVSLFTDEVAPLAPDEVSEAFLWIASDAAAHITGAEFKIDCGFSAS